METIAFRWNILGRQQNVKKKPHTGELGPQHTQHKGALISIMALSPFRSPPIIFINLVAIPQQDVNILLGNVNKATEADLIQEKPYFYK